MTFRLRLAIALATFAVVLSSIIGVLTVSAARNVVDTEIDRSLLATSEEFDRELNRELLRLNEVLELDASKGGSNAKAPSKDRTKSIGSGSYIVRERLSDPSVVVQIFALDGSLVSGPVIVPEGIGPETVIPEGSLNTVGDQRALLIRRDVYTIIFTRSLKVREEFVADLTKRSFLTAGGGLICALIISWLLARRLSKRLDDLASSARSAVNGSTNALVVDGADEIAELATAINSLVLSVKASSDHQKELFRYAGHELRTPLTAAMLNTDILLRHQSTLSEVEKTKLLKTLREQLSGLERVSDEVAEIATGAARAQSIEPIDLLSKAREAGIIFSQAHKHKVKISGVEAVVLADPKGINRIIENLLSNAVKYGGLSPVEIKINSNEGWGELIVRDHGTGFNEREIGSLLEPFRRGRDVQSISGSGLGLAIVLDIVTVLGGFVELSNHPIKGAIVKISIPLAK